MPMVLLLQQKENVKFKISYISQNCSPKRKTYRSSTCVGASAMSPPTTTPPSPSVWRRSGPAGTAGTTIRNETKGIKIRARESRCNFTFSVQDHIISLSWGPLSTLSLIFVSFTGLRFIGAAPTLSFWVVRSTDIALCRQRWTRKSSSLSARRSRTSRKIMGCSESGKYVFTQVSLVCRFIPENDFKTV